MKSKNEIKSMLFELRREKNTHIDNMVGLIAEIKHDPEDMEYYRRRILHYESTMNALNWVLNESISEENLLPGLIHNDKN